MISFIIPTYNRCPFSSIDKNPLIWCLNSLVNQKHVSKIIIVDDCSSDFTNQHVNSFLKGNFNFPILYIRNNKRLGNLESKNIGFSKISSEYVSFCDDDTIYQKNFTSHAINYLDKINSTKLASLSFPIYVRSLVPKKIVPENKIGKMNIPEGRWEANFDCSTAKTGKPFRVDLLNNIAIIKTKVLKRVGGWPKPSDIYHMESFDLGYKIQDQEYELWHCTDPITAILHLKFGSYRTGAREDSSEINFKVGNIDWEEMIKISSSNRVNTGLRMDLDSYYFFENYGIMYFLMPLSESGTKSFLKRSYNSFVINNTPFSLTYPPSKLNKKAREELWISAIKKAISDSEVDCSRKARTLEVMSKMY